MTKDPMLVDVLPSGGFDAIIAGAALSLNSISVITDAWRLRKTKL